MMRAVGTEMYARPTRAKSTSAIKKAIAKKILAIRFTSIFTNLQNNLLQQTHVTFLRFFRVDLIFLERILK